MARYQAVRGTFDVLPDRMPTWHSVERTSRDLAHRFGYREIRTPLFEEAELFTRGMGVLSGLIEKELWTFQDKFGQKLALRTDATTGVVRAFQQNKLYNAKLPVKVYYLAPVFLLGKEGEARSRQSHQFGFEAIGCNNAALDAEVIALAASYCETLGLEDYQIRLNSLGGKECRPVYLQKLRDYFNANNGQLCSTCKRKYKANPDWVLSCTEESCKTLSQVAPTIYGMLTNEAKASFGQLREYLREMELPVELDPTVVRDSEYYNGTVFEVRCQGKSLGFGGRYDTLVEKLGGKPTPAVGFAFSLESVLDALGESTHDTEAPTVDVLLRPEGPESAKLLVPLLYTLRQRGVSAELDYSSGNGRRQKAVEGFSYLVTLDESNAFRGNAILRDLEENTDEKVSVQRLRNRVLHVAGVGAEEEQDGSKSGRKKLRRGRRRPEEDSNASESRNSSQDDDSSSGRSSRRGRGKTRKPQSSEGRESRGRGRGRDRDRDRDREKDSNRDRDDGRDKVTPEVAVETKSSEKPARSARKRRPSREREPSSETKTRERAPGSTSNAPDSGKAIVPVFGMGLGTASAPAPKSASKKKAGSKKKAKKKKASATAAAAAGSGGSLNWSILPEKEGA